MVVLAFLSIVLCAQGLSLRGSGESTMAPVAPLSETDLDLAAVLFEVDNEVALPMVAMNIRHRLPNAPIQIFYGVNNSVYVKNQPTLRKLREEGKLTLTPIPKPFFEHLDWYQYSILFESPEFWRATLDAKKLLVLQTDAWLCPHAASLLKDKFMQYNYVGAPFNHSFHDLEKECPDGVGNGGLSLRDRAVMINITETFGPVAKEGTQEEYAEDSYFCKHVPTSNKPTAEEAKRFALQEMVFDGGDLVGFHCPWTTWQSQKRTWPSQKDAAEKVCPGLHLIEEAWNKIDNSSTFAKSEEAVQKVTALFAQEEKQG